MDAKERKEILKKLEEIGFNIDNDTKEKILISFEDYIKREYENEKKLLNETLRIKKKELRNEELTPIEKSFIKYISLNYL